MITKFKTAADFRKSLENRLKKMAMETNSDLQRLRMKVAFDRLLARLLNHKSPPFILKGGYAMELRFANARATKDIDLTCLQRVREGQNSIAESIRDELRQLAFKNLNDFFMYQIGDAQADLDNAPYGGARYPISSFIDGKLFVRFQLDVGADAIINEVETLHGKDWLGFCGISAPIIKMIAIEQQFAEKLHAYTLPRSGRNNTRVKDLIDMFLLTKMRTLNPSVLKDSLEKVFKIRKTHSLPSELEQPPQEWQRPYSTLATECNIALSINEAFAEIVNIYKQVSESPS